MGGILPIQDLYPKGYLVACLLFGTGPCLLGRDEWSPEISVDEDGVGIGKCLG